MKAGVKTASPPAARRARPRGVANPRNGAPTRPAARSPHEPRGLRPGPQTAPVPRPVERPSRAKTTSQAKARAKARKAKAPKVVRLPLRERLRARLIARLAGVDLRPQALLARIPFVVLVIGALGVGLAITLWLSTDAAQRSYQLGSARSLNDALTQQKEALERDVLEAQSAPALADAARNLGMIPSRDTAHLVQDPAGNWVVVGKPKPAEGAPPPPLNTKLPDLKPTAGAGNPVPAKPKPGSSAEVPSRLVAPVPPVITLPPVGVPAPGAPAPPEIPMVVPSLQPASPLTAGGVLPPVAPAQGGLVLTPVALDAAPAPVPAPDEAGAVGVGQ